ncbi:thiol peroxidase [bacterium]|nr:thiol peroxidase [bacterium]
MSNVISDGDEVQIDGSFLTKGDLAPDFALCGSDLETKTLGDFQGKRKVIATVPSVDTEVCASESLKINDLAIAYPSVYFLVVSKDLPFALKRFCASTSLHNIVPLSDLRTRSGFGKNYGIKIASGALDGLLARSIILLDSGDKVVYSELCSDIKQMPDFEALQKALEE